MSEIKKFKDKIKAIIAQNGFHQFILIDSEGGIIQQEIKPTKPSSSVQPQVQTLANLIITIKNSASVIGKDKFKTFIVSRKNGRNIFIFPVGKFYLGVIKSTNVNETLNIDDQLNRLVNTQLNNLIINLMDATKYR